MATTPVTPIAMLAGSSQQAGAKQPQHVLLVDTGGNPYTAGGGSGGTSQNDGTAFVPGSGSLTPVGGLYETSPSAVSDGDIAAIGITSLRAVKVTLYNTAGNELSPGAGVQYTKGDVDTTPTGTVAMGVNASNEVNPLVQDASGYLLVSVQGTPALPTGAATAARQDTGNASLASIDGKTPALGQALAAASVPIVLTAAQLSTLTPPAAITGFSTETTLAALNAKVTAVNTGAVTVSAALPAGANNIGDVDLASAIPAGTNLIGNVGHGKTIKTVSGTFTADTDVIAAVSTKRLKVIAISLFTFGTSATTITWKSNGTGGTEIARDCLQSVASQVMGIKAAIAAPSFLFATAAGEKLTADTTTSDTIHYTITYFDDDAV